MDREILIDYQQVWGQYGPLDGGPQKDSHMIPTTRPRVPSRNPSLLFYSVKNWSKEFRSIINIHDTIIFEKTTKLYKTQLNDAYFEDYIFLL